MAILRVLSFNILCDWRADPPHRWADRREYTSALLRFYNPDIFCLQEALAGQLDDVAGALADYGWTGVGREDGKALGEFVPIFYRKSAFEPEESGHFWLSEKPEEVGSVGWDAAMPRTAVWQRLRNKADGKRVLVVNTHYDHMGKKARKRSSTLINQQIGKIWDGKEGLVLCADMNAQPGTPPYQEIMREGLIDASRAEGIAPYGPTFTYHAFQMGAYIMGQRKRMPLSDSDAFHTIDYILYKGGLAPERFGVIDDNLNGLYPSDHFAQLCDFVLL